MNESVFAYKAALQKDALRIPVNNLGRDVKEAEWFDKPSITNCRCALNDSTPKASNRLVQACSFVKVDTSEVQLAKVSALQSNEPINLVTAIKLIILHCSCELSMYQYRWTNKCLFGGENKLSWTVVTCKIPSMTVT